MRPSPPPASPTTGSGRPRRRPHDWERRPGRGGQREAAAVWWRRASGLPRNLTSEIHQPRARERHEAHPVACVNGRVVERSRAVYVARAEPSRRGWCGSANCRTESVQSSILGCEGERPPKLFVPAAPH
jgi:hypothetical protein